MSEGGKGGGPGPPPPPPRAALTSGCPHSVAVPPRLFFGGVVRGESAVRRESQVGSAVRFEVTVSHPDAWLLRRGDGGARGTPGVSALLLPFLPYAAGWGGGCGVWGGPCCPAHATIPPNSTPAGLQPGPVAEDAGLSLPHPPLAPRDQQWEMAALPSAPGTGGFPGAAGGLQPCRQPAAPGPGTAAGGGHGDGSMARVGPCRPHFMPILPPSRSHRGRLTALRHPLRGPGGCRHLRRGGRMSHW